MTQILNLVFLVVTMRQKNMKKLEVTPICPPKNFAKSVDEITLSDGERTKSRTSRKRSRLKSISLQKMSKLFLFSIANKIANFDENSVILTNFI